MTSASAPEEQVVVVVSKADTNNSTNNASAKPTSFADEGSVTSENDNCYQSLNDLQNDQTTSSAVPTKQNPGRGQGQQQRRQSGASSSSLSTPLMAKQHSRSNSRASSASTTTAPSAYAAIPTQSTDHCLSYLNLNNRQIRLTLWAIVYFVFSLAEFVGNTILAAHVYPRSAYRWWAASDFFLLIASVLLFYDCNEHYLITDLQRCHPRNVLHKCFRICCCVCFIVGGCLRWFGLGDLDRHICAHYKRDTGGFLSNDYCRSWHFAQDYCATYFSIMLGVDCILIELEHNACLPGRCTAQLGRIFNERFMRMLIYSCLTILVALVTAADLDYDRTQIKALNDSDSIRAAEAGFFLAFLILLIICVLLVLQRYRKYAGNYAGSKYVHSLLSFLIFVAMALIYFSHSLLYQGILALAMLLFIVYDFQFVFEGK